MKAKDEFMILIFTLSGRLTNERFGISTQIASSNCTVLRSNSAALAAERSKYRLLIFPVRSGGLL